jgi:G:T/U-mismatch repair DNA glycosylase
VRPDAQRGAAGRATTDDLLTFERAKVFVLPNPSGRNANFSYAEMLKAYRALAGALTNVRRPDRPFR